MALERGKVTEEQLSLLLKLTKISSRKVITALEMYLVEGLTQKEATSRVGINQSFLSIRLNTLRSVDRVVEQLQEHYS
ncbi:MULTISPECIES: PapB/FocB family fimbrial expression transcriptional regulator [Vibrio]|uniref:NADH-quinone reductase n=1 Tax=Vibrio mediterranei TaxID=689 RepID=A0A3G4VJC2_9VIBR|nr:MULTISPECIES: PapB/FocB family fimbrial expression transcriptional regulator [Vibrio]AYV23692.1 NADH-quinone reductase [Vibrio mediterranei]EDL55246.1 Na(+)-translocating NADH-quinone reductase subunit C [Vibrio mediterranei AK1]MCG9789795.1 adhesin biosynthesis transcription regulatory family protein [Vibrio mediterranei]MDA0108798.1 PapB/FocB family fimbrial expression transcriptional regulator [Vibrio sp. La 4.2.2]NOH28201.1 NADH-quinone reductase [Vibrio mediterranei]